jgi:hypothetical protein
VEHLFKGEAYRQYRLRYKSSNNQNVKFEQLEFIGSNTKGKLEVIFNGVGDLL